MNPFDYDHSRTPIGYSPRAVSEIKDFSIGDRVICHLPGSWVDGKHAVIKAINVTSSDGVFGHYLAVEPNGGMTIVEPECLELIS